VAAGSLAACGAAPSAPAQVPALPSIPVKAPFFAYGTDLHWHVAAPDGTVRGSPPKGPVDRGEFSEVRRPCASGKAREGAALCIGESPSQRHSDCIEACVVGVNASRVPPTLAPSGHASTSPPTPQRPAWYLATSGSLPLPVAAHTPDSLELVLHNCVVAVRETSAPPVCHFDRPLDEMDFGQRHCDEQCARATGTAVSRPEQ
jgi:hypothetical protein